MTDKIYLYYNGFKEQYKDNTRDIIVIPEPTDWYDHMTVSTKTKL